MRGKDPFQDLRWHKGQAHLWETPRSAQTRVNIARFAYHKERAESARAKKIPIGFGTGASDARYAVGGRTHRTSAVLVECVEAAKFTFNSFREESKGSTNIALAVDRVAKLVPVTVSRPVPK